MVGLAIDPIPMEEVSEDIPQEEDNNGETDDYLNEEFEVLQIHTHNVNKKLIIRKTMRKILKRLVMDQVMKERENHHLLLILMMYYRYSINTLVCLELLICPPSLSLSLSLSGYWSRE